MRKLYAAVLLPLLFACTTPHAAQSTAANDTTLILRDPRDAAAISDAYHERVRLGLGSPFRTIEIAARDPRLSDDVRDELLTDLFDRVQDGDTYEIGATLPIAHYRVIEHALNSTHDPRIAELAVNLAYEVAVIERTVTPEMQYAAASTVALMRDRELAKHDAKHVRDVARTHGLEAHTLVPAMRAQRNLLVEQPLQPALIADAEEAASKLALMLVGGVRQAERTRAYARAPQPAGELTRDVAERILELQGTDQRPPQSALMIAMRAAGLPISARDEEAFVAELALEPEHSTLAAQRAAISLRPFAQEPVYSAVSPVPTAPEFLTRYGVRIVFLDDVPEKWQPYYRWLLDQALGDLHYSAVPGLNLTGLTIEIGDVQAGSRHLAYHDPKARTIRWAPETGSGSLAHEIAHDLDWQIARRSYGRSGYASDLVGDIASMLLLTRGDPDENVRASEVFARQFDWVVAAALAVQGRMNGHLSSVQHDWLPGHGSARPPLANSRSANALAGMVTRGGRLGPAGREQVERAVRADDLPAAVSAVRHLRHGTERPAGPRRSIFETTSQTATADYVELLALVAGAVPVLPAAAESGITIGPNVLYLQR